MNKNDDPLGPYNHPIAFLALYGMVSSLLDPPSKEIFIEAHRAIFDLNSPELKKLSELLGIEIKTLQDNLIKLLKSIGFECDATQKH
jgi:hypothetical protein